MSISPVSFGYKWTVKKLFNEGKLPMIKKDIYGKPLKVATVEHIIPKSKGGKSNPGNYALANAYDNMKRGSDDILKHTTVQNIKEYFEQFIDVNMKGCHGNKYIKDAKRTLKKLNIEI